MKPAAAVVLLLALVAGCGSRPQSQNPDEPPPPPPPAPSPGEVTLNGSERLAWEQSLSGADVGTFAFVAFIDGARAMLGNTSCTGGGSTASCSASLPPMSPGRHLLQLAAVRQTTAGFIEGARSPAIIVNMLAAGASTVTPSAAAQPAPADAPAAADDARPSIDVVARGVRDVTDLAAAPGGGVFVAQRRGIIRILRRGALGDPALVLPEAVRDTAPLALLSIAVAPDFEKSRRLYFVYSAPVPEGIAYRLVTGREVGGRIGELATLVTIGSALPGGAAIVRVARDGALTIAAADRVYRLDAGGGTPESSTSRDGVIAVVPHVTALDLASDSGDVYAMTAPDGPRVLTRLRPEAARREGDPVHAWAAAERPVAMTWYGGTAIAAFAGRMLVGTAGATLQAIDVSTPARASIEISLGDAGRVSAMTVDEYGSVFVAAAGRVQPAASGADTDAGGVILRLHPREGGQ
ncbi:MAG TPA: PQQ-dependent sugar dehydrogenase [Vicinamibacterales bacterium]|nr:PQQ-dependent sugar dehydrogenase [Vicinamibacterales bacterium]